MIGSRRGVSLLEMLIGVFLICFLGLVLFQTIQASKSSIEFSSEHFSAMMLSQKVMEDCTQEVMCNPLGIEALGLEAGVEGQITDGASVFFSGLEDRHPPWQRIDPNLDGNLDRNQEPLFSLVKDFSLSVKAEREAIRGVPSADKGIFRTTIAFSWKGTRGNGRVEYPCCFAAPITKRKADPDWVISDAIVEQELCRTLFRDPNTTLDQVIAVHGGNKETLLALGRLRFLSGSFLDSPTVLLMAREIEKNQQKLETLAAVPVSRSHYDLVCRLASDSYLLGKAAYQAIYFLQKDTEFLRNNMNQASLGRFLWVQGFPIQTELDKLQRMVDMMLLRLNWARFYLGILLEKEYDQFQDIKWQYFRLHRSLDLSRILYSLGAVDKTRLFVFYDKLKEFSQGRNQFLERLIRQEKMAAATVGSLCQKYPALGEVVTTVQAIRRPVPGVPTP